MKAVALLFLLALPAGAAPPVSGAYSLRTERPSYLLGEPIYLRIVSLQSRPPSLEEGSLTLGVQPLPGLRAKPGSGSVGVEVGEILYHPPLRLRARPREPGEDSLTALGIPIAPSQKTFIRYARLIANEGGLLIPKPGRYRLRLHSGSPTGSPAGSPAGSQFGDSAGSTILSDSLTVTIRAPTTREDRRAWALISGNPDEYALAVYLEGGDQIKSGMAILRGLAGFRSAYTRMASFVLASDWSQDFTDYGGGPSRPLDLEKALGFAQWDLGPGAYIPLRIAYRLKSAAAEVAARDPNSPGLAAVLRRLHDFEASLAPEDQALYQSF